jgi:hypothetical protein
MKRVPNTEIFSEMDECHYLLIDGVVSQRLLERAVEKGVKFIVSVNFTPSIKKPADSEIELYLIKDF